LAEQTRSPNYDDTSPASSNISAGGSAFGWLFAGWPASEALAERAVGGWSVTILNNVFFIGQFNSNLLEKPNSHFSTFTNKELFGIPIISNHPKINAYHLEK